jgi:hypothetical protein
MCIHGFSALLTFIGIQSFSFRFLANDFLVAKGGRIIHRGYCICCCCCRLVSNTTTTMGDNGPPFCFWRLGVCLRGGAVVTAVGAGLVVVAPPGCRTKFRTERLEIQPCCSTLLVVVLVLVFDFLECRSLLEEYCSAAARGMCSWTSSSSRYLGKLLQRLQRRVFVCLRACWLLYCCRIVLYRRLVLVVWLWFGCSKVVGCWLLVVGGCCCWLL